MIPLILRGVRSIGHNVVNKNINSINSINIFKSTNSTIFRRLSTSSNTTTQAWKTGDAAAKLGLGILMTGVGYACMSGPHLTQVGPDAWVENDSKKQ